MADEALMQTEEQQNPSAPDQLYVQGFHFLTRQDAQKAAVDAERIKVISTHMANGSVQSMMAVYEKSIQNKIFSTPVGWSFLHGIRQQLVNAGVPEEQLMPVPMTTSFTRPVNPPAQAQTAPPAQPEPVRKERKTDRGKKEEKQKTPLLVLSVVLNLVLIGLVIAMFAVLNYGETVNMLNYKQQYTNEYAIMKQELQQEIHDKKKELLERERAVSERENALNNGGE